MVGRIIHCSDLILRVNDSQLQDIGNLTEWIIESTDFRPFKPDTCELRDELDSHQKVVVIAMIWTFLIFLSIFYCYFCEQKLFPSQKLFDTCLVDRSGFLDNGRCPNDDCNVNKRFPTFHKKIVPQLEKYRSSHLKSPSQSFSSTGQSNASSDSSLSIGEFRLLSTNEYNETSDREYLLKKRIL